MKKALLTAAILTFGIAGMHAQDNQSSSKVSTPATAKAGNPKMMATMRANRLEKELQLTPEQKQQVIDIFTAASANTDKAAARKEADAKIKAILTDDQAKRYEALKEQRKEAAKENAAN